MATSGFLISPRVRVFWGDVNLSSYSGGQKFPKDSPVVYDVQVDLQAEGEGPTAEMKWDPTGPGFALYEWFINPGGGNYMRKTITIEYFYPGGKKIVFEFVWSGQSINYGNDMSVTVKMVSQLSGLINANLRNTAQAYDEESGAAALDVYKKAQKQFGLDGVDGLLKFNETSLAYAQKAKITAAYGNDWTFGNNVGNIAKQTGDMAFGINIGGASIVIMPPFSYKGSGAQETVLNGATDVGQGALPDPAKRYGYVVGPSIYNSITRTFNWKPPQQDNTKNPGTQPLTQKTDTADTTLQTPPTPAQTAAANTSTAAAPTSSPLGTANNRSSPNVLNKKNPEAQARQDALNDEKASELTMDTMMVPVLVGIKPHDILYVPSLTGDYIEDWIVQSVGYAQSNGDVKVKIRATRVLGSGVPMNESAANVFKTFSQTKRLIGANATLEAWDSYAWGLPSSSATGTTNPTLDEQYLKSAEAFD
jgi:hypothetical protein